MTTPPQDDLTAEREKVKGLREWAERKAKAGVQFISVLTDGEVHGLVAKLLRAEHARAVRIVLRLMKQAEKEHRLNQYNAMAEVLTALQRGRGGKG